MKKFLLLAGALTALFTVPAGAADLGRPRPVYARPVVAPPVLYTWTGCYIGGNGGGLWAHRDWSGISGFADSQNINGGLGGLQGGCNYQVSQWVFGAQFDWDWTSANNNSVNPAFPFLNDRSNIKSLGSATGRVGYAWERTLFYVKGGGAWLRSDINLLQTPGGIASLTDTRRGWTIGVGGEYAFLDWLTGFVEYDYYNFRDNNNTFLCVAPGCPAAALPINVTTNVNVFKAGVNLKIGPNVRWF
jgi:outer membrane immunogenic protein